MQPGDNEYIGAVKIKDGLFMGDCYAAQDFELLITNKVTHIINCSAREQSNHWEPVGITYFSLPWQESDYQNLFESRTDVLTQIYKFIESALTKGESVLVHSVRGQNRCACVIAAYCMKKYRWTLYKTMEFIQSRKPNVAIRHNFFSQMLSLESKLSRMGLGAKTSDWSEIGDNPKNLGSDELLITNTFLNAKSTAHSIEKIDFSKKENKVDTIKWVDQHPDDPQVKQPILATIIPNRSKEKSLDSIFPKNKKSSLEKKEPTIVRSILKGSDKVFVLQGENKDKADPTKGQPPSIDPNASPILAGRKGIGKLRPGSSMISNGRSHLLKSNSTSGLEKIDQEGNIPNIQGNIIHITVNNFITNSEATNNAKIMQRKSESRTQKDRKSGLSLSASGPDFNKILAKSSAVSSSQIFDKSQREIPPLSVSQNPKLNNFLRESASASNDMFGLSRISSVKNDSQVPSSVRKTGAPIQGYRVNEDEQNNLFYHPNTGIMKMMGQGKTVPVRVVNDLEISRSPQNFTIKKKSGDRPLTAPNKNLQNSPYFHPENYPQKQTKEISNSGYKRSGSLQSKGEPKTIVIKSKVRNQSPAGSNLNHVNQYFSTTYRSKIQY